MARDGMLRGIIGPDGERYANVNDLLEWMGEGAVDPGSREITAAEVLPNMIAQVKFWAVTVGQGVFNDQT